VSFSVASFSARNTTPLADRLKPRASVAAPPVPTAPGNSTSHQQFRPAESERNVTSRQTPNGLRVHSPVFRSLLLCLTTPFRTYRVRMETPTTQKSTIALNLPPLHQREIESYNSHRRAELAITETSTSLRTVTLPFRLDLEILSRQEPTLRR
jgi:hypothetical protein